MILKKKKYNASSNHARGIRAYIVSDMKQVIYTDLLNRDVGLG